ncbi:MAG TPA: phosphatase PAP2 family protein [Bacteroidota bacterium]|nr:phosphatase PAP2 family protein [Bacteroidota bacterium]
MILIKYVWMIGLLILSFTSARGSVQDLIDVSRASVPDWTDAAGYSVWDRTDAVRDSVHRNIDTTRDSVAVTVVAPASADSGRQTVSVNPAAISDTVSASGVPKFFRRLGNAFVTQASSPFTMNAAQAAYVGAGVGITLGFVALDENIDRSIRNLKNDNTVIRDVSSSITELGGKNGIAAVIVYSAYSLIWDDTRAQETSMLLAEAIITSGVWTRLGKLAAGRERPSAAYEFSHLPGGRWHGLGGSLRKHSKETVTKYDAFPSGHTATAFAIATVFAKRYSETGYVPILSYSLATLIGFTRMIEHTHWASDVFAGACLGYLCGNQVVTQFEREESETPVAGTGTTVRFSIGMLNESPALHFTVGF